MCACRALASQSSSFGWAEYDGQIDELLDGSEPAPAAAAQHPAECSAAMLPTADGSPAEPVSSLADAAASVVVVLSDGSEGSDWNDDDIMMTLSDGAREYDARATVSGMLCACRCNSVHGHHDLQFAPAWQAEPSTFQGNPSGVIMYGLDAKAVLHACRSVLKAL